LNALKILLAVDHTQQAEEAARGVPDCFPGAEVEILYALDIESVPHSHLSAALIDKYHQKIRARLQAEANKFLPAMMSLFLRAAGRVRILMREGRASDVILKAAVSFHPDLIVLGSRGLSGIQAWLLGGVSYRVAEQAPCPVLLCKHLLPPVPKLLLVVDRTGVAERAVRFLTEQRPFQPGHIVVLLIDRASITPDIALTRMKEDLSARQFSVDARLLTGDPMSGILQCAQREAIDVIIMGVSNVSGWWRRWLERTLSHSIMVTAPSSVLIIHEITSLDGKEEEAE
jgi:nucleotide-binding universal stress UspA family protein